MRTGKQWVMVLVVGLAVSAQGQNVKEPAKAEAMEFEIVPKPGQLSRPAFFEARFTNHSDKEVSIPWRDTLYEDMFLFTVTGPDGKPLVPPARRMAPPVLSGPGEFVRVPPGGT